MMSTDVGCVFTFWVDEKNMDATDSAMTDIFNAMEQEEFPTGNVKTYTVHRVVDEPGTYIMYEYFTAAGSERHSAGPLMMKAGAQLTSLMVKPYDRVVMEPFHAAGIGEPIAGYRDPNFKPSANDVAVVFTFQAHPLETKKAELAMADIFAAMEQEEFPTGDVKTYTVHRSDTPGRYVMYEYFTAAGSERHASGPLMQEAGHKLVRPVHDSVCAFDDGARPSGRCRGANPSGKGGRYGERDEGNDTRRGAVCRRRGS